MNKLSERVIRKKEIWKLYYKLLNNIEQIKLFEHDLNNTAPWFIDCLVENKHSWLFLRIRELGQELCILRLIGKRHI